MPVPQEARHTVTARRTSAWRRALLVLAVGQVVSSIAGQAAGMELTTPDRAGEPPVVPVGWAFSIWGLIELLSLAYAVWALPDGRPDRRLRNELAVPLTVVFAGFSCWLAAAEVEPVWTTVAVFAVMVAGLLKALQIALRNRDAIARWPRAGRWLAWWTIGIYSGWSTMAIWINLTTAMAGSGAPVGGARGIGAQLAVLAGATMTAVAVIRWSNGLLPYTLAACWALATAGLGAADAGEALLAAAAAAGLCTAAATTVHARRREDSDRT
ncbi:hypothetical protein LO771_27635 [Streptacidiphilus sp. ASG 303]|uniref:hypothetical protein n=1 Tax=Streptacidiphilus sp. ASG 303 TaxID=2896847 RepID=UPI001E4303B5|nr:hypothetical protein [Streptacidiphilus sp. ASG 303]MCD0486056.1 hypothetical protein [Streptacidiphilus sp. ASG 303]